MIKKKKETKELKSHILQIKVTPSLKRKIKEYAEKEKRSMASFIESIIKSYIDRKEGKQKAKKK